MKKRPTILPAAVLRHSVQQLQEIVRHWQHKLRWKRRGSPIRVGNRRRDEKFQSRRSGAQVHGLDPLVVPADRRRRRIHTAYTARSTPAIAHPCPHEITDFGIKMRPPAFLVGPESSLNAYVVVPTTFLELGRDDGDDGFPCYGAAEKAYAARERADEDTDD